MGDISDPVAKLGDHTVDHFTNEKIVLNDENARRVLRLVRHLSFHVPNEPSANCLLGFLPDAAGVYLMDAVESARAVC